MERRGFWANLSYFFKGPDGSMVICQRPNIPLLGWMLFKLISVFMQDKTMKDGFESLSKLSLFTWAYLEITSGQSYFRRVLGGAVMMTIIISYFK